MSGEGTGVRPKRNAYEKLSSSDGGSRKVSIPDLRDSFGGTNCNEGTWQRGRNGPAWLAQAGPLRPRCQVPSLRPASNYAVTRRVLDAINGTQVPSLDPRWDRSRGRSSAP